MRKEKKMTICDVEYNHMIKPVRKERKRTAERRGLVIWEGFEFEEIIRMDEGLKGEIGEKLAILHLLKIGEFKLLGKVHSAYRRGRYPNSDILVNGETILESKLACQSARTKEGYEWHVRLGGTDPNKSEFTVYHEVKPHIITSFLTSTEYMQKVYLINNPKESIKSDKGLKYRKSDRASWPDIGEIIGEITRKEQLDEIFKSLW